MQTEICREASLDSYSVVSDHGINSNYLLHFLHGVTSIEYLVLIASYTARVKKVAVENKSSLTSVLDLLF